MRVVDDTRPWSIEAACRGLTVFYVPMRESTAARHLRELSAKAICAQCPVRRECLEYALRVSEPLGIWGGLNELERNDLNGRVW